MPVLDLVTIGCVLVGGGVGEGVGGKDFEEGMGGDELECSTVGEVSAG